MRGFGFAALLILMLFGCVQTQYRQSYFKGGYREIQIAEDRFELAVYGNAYTSKPRIRDYFLYRAAELTLAHDRSYFLLYGDKSSKRPISIAGFIPTRDNLVAYGISGTKFGNTGVVKILDSKPEVEPIYYDAQLLVDQLKDRVR